MNVMNGIAPGGSDASAFMEIFPAHLALGGFFAARHVAVEQREILLGSSDFWFIYLDPTPAISNGRLG